MSYATQKLRDISVIKTGKLDSNAAVENGAYPFFTCDPQTLRINKWAYDTEAVLLAGNNASGNYTAKYYRGKFNAYQRTYIIEAADSERLSVRFLCYAINQQLRLLKAMSSGSTTKFLTIRMLHNLDIPCPEIEVQDRIVNVLGTIDDLIENNQKQIKLLEETARRLYKEWFVNFRFPGYEDTPIVDGVPEGWERLPVGELIEKIPRTTQIMASEYGKEGPIPIIDQSREFIAGYTDNHASLVNVGKPVIVFGDHTRILKYIQFPFAKGADGTQLIVSNTDRMPQSLFYCSLVGVDLSNYHYARHFKYLKAEELLVPTQVIAEAFDHFVSPMFSKIQRLRDINKAATNARDRLLPKLISGEIEV